MSYLFVLHDDGDPGAIRYKAWFTSAYIRKSVEDYHGMAAKDRQALRTTAMHRVAYNTTSRHTTPATTTNLDVHACLLGTCSLAGTLAWATHQSSKDDKMEDREHTQQHVIRPILLHAIQTTARIVSCLHT